MLPLNAIGKQIFGFSRWGNFSCSWSMLNQNLMFLIGIQDNHPVWRQAFLMNILEKYGWIMDPLTGTWWLLLQMWIKTPRELKTLTNLFCFPPFPVIGMFLKFLQQQKVICVMVVPAVYSPWRNLLEAHVVSEFLLSEPFDKQAFTITHPTGRRVPKWYPHSMMAVLLDFLHWWLICIDYNLVMYYLF